MSTEIVPINSPSVIATAQVSILPELVERAGGAARFAWDEFFFAEHHNPHTQKAYMAAVKRFLSWCEGQGVELSSGIQNYLKNVPMAIFVEPLPTDPPKL